MSLRRMKTLYCVSVMAVALILAALAGPIGVIAAIVILAGALPGWKVAIRTAATSALRSAKATLILPEDVHRSPAVDQSSEDRQANRQSVR